MTLGLFLELLAPGGVQRAGRHAAASLSRLSREARLPCRLLSLGDPTGEHLVTVGGAGATVVGFGGSRLRFAAAVLRAAPRVRCAYVAHPNLAALALPLRAVCPRARIWIVAHGIDVWEPLSMARRLGLRAATGAIAVSEATAERLVEVQRVPRERVVVIPNALDPDLHERARDAPVERARRLLTIARLAASERYKGVDHVIRALPAVLADVPGAKYVVVGDGDDRPRLEALAHETGVADRVSFVGRASGAELDRELRSAALFAMPSGGEGFGIVYLEAMAYGIPVIAAASGGAPEVVRDGETGFLVPYGDVSALAERVVTLLRNEELRRRLGAAARRRAGEFTLDRIHPRLAETLRCAA